MRFLIIVKASSESEAGALPAAGLIAQMDAFHEALARAGALLDAAALMPSAAGWRIRYEDDQRSVATGPFTCDPNLIAGYTLIEARSREEALEWARRFPNPRGEGLPAEIELRPLYAPEDFPPSAANARLRSLGGGQ